MTLHPHVPLIIVGVGAPIVGVLMTLWLLNPKRIEWLMPPEQATRTLGDRPFVMRVLIAIAVVWALVFILLGIGIG